VSRRDLVQAWRDRAAELRTWAAAEGAARALEQAAAELEAALREHDDELLTLAEASAESGYSERRLRELRAAGELQDYGRPGAPRFRRADLPRKPRREREPSTTDYDPKEHAQRIAARMRVS